MNEQERRHLEAAVQDDLARGSQGSWKPGVRVTTVAVTLDDGEATVHVEFIDVDYPDERFAAEFHVPRHLEHEGEPSSMMPMIASHARTALGELTWAGGEPLLRPRRPDGTRWYRGDII